MKLKIETRHVDVVVVNHLKEMNAQPKIPFITAAKERGIGRKIAKQKLSEIQSNQDDKEFFFGEIHIDQLDSVNQSTRLASSKLVKPELLIFRNVVRPSIDDHLNHPMI